VASCSSRGATATFLEFPGRYQTLERAVRGEILEHAPIRRWFSSAASGDFVA
jgi:hypothetical protein